MFAHSYSENSHERAGERNILSCTVLVFSWRRNDTAESSSLWSGAGSAFHVDSQRLQRCMDRNELTSWVESRGRHAQQNAGSVDESFL